MTLNRVIAVILRYFYLNSAASRQPMLSAHLFCLDFFSNVFFDNLTGPGPTWSNCTESIGMTCSVSDVDAYEWVLTGVNSETAEYFHQTTLQLPSSDTTQHQQQRDGRQSASGSQTILTASTAASSAAAMMSRSDVVINIDEKQPLICRSDHILTIDTVCTGSWC